MKPAYHRSWDPPHVGSPADKSKNLPNKPKGQCTGAPRPPKPKPPCTTPNDQTKITQDTQALSPGCLALHILHTLRMIPIVMYKVCNTQSTEHAA